MSDINVMDTTLRDGSYTVDFNFSIGDTKTICSELESAGIKYIEIGHGIGIGAALIGHKPAIHTDAEYIQAAKSIVKNSKIGMFSITKMTPLDSIKEIAKQGLDFIRIGSDIANVSYIPKYVETAKNAGLITMCNIMKSYVLPPDEFANIVADIEKSGVDIVYLVDSAGGMFPQDIINYYKAIRSKSQIKLGFHGHDNLGCAVANAITAAQIGYDFIDTSLQGLGRSAGNPSTEIFVAAMQKQGKLRDINLIKLLDIGQLYIKDLSNNKKNDIDIIAGFADFHSSYMNIIYKYAAKYSIDPRILIIELTKIDKMNAPEELVDKIAKNIKEHNSNTIKFKMYKYIGNEQ